MSLKAFGRRIHALRWLVIGAWILALLVSSFFAKDVESVLRGGAGAIKGSQSLMVDTLLYRDFDNPFTKVAIVTFKSARLTTDHPDFQAAVAKIKKDLVEKPFIRETLSYYDAKDERMRTEDGHALAMLVGMKAKDMREEEKILPELREAIRETKEAYKKSGLLIETTGRSALTYDFNIISSKDSTKAEGRAIPLTLMVLLLAFGSLVAAGLPLFMGIFSTTVTMGLIVLLGQSVELSTLTQNIATMLGLAVGIDYSLLMVNRFREGLKERLSVSEAIAETLATSGKAVIYSGLAVLTGLCGLFLTPLFETQSVGVGGTMVVAVSVLAALTLVPAILSVCGTFIDWPPQFSKSIQSEASKEAWRKWASFLMDRPVRALLVALVLIGTMVWPVQKFVSGFPSQKWFPLAMESRRGLDVLADMKQGWSIFPVYLIVEKKEENDTPILAPRYLAKLLKVSRAINGDPLVGSVVGPVDLQPGLSSLNYLMLYSNLEKTLSKYPKISQLFLSHDRKSTLFQVVMKDSATLEESKAAVKRWEKLDVGENLKIKVGGQLVFYNDYDEAMNASFPRVIAFVLFSTFLVLFFAYRSFLIPLKAILMNLLSVGAGYGALVAVFLLGWGRQLIGLSEVVDGIPQSIPLIIFCVVFGLSMDYEVFLLSRIKESYDQSGDNRAATAEGLALTGGIITSAALIMVFVFGAFAWADMVLVKMLGLGLAVAVLVDATVIRCLAVPAFMRIAGRWNWYPGEKGK
ncbi:MAG TPA: hypothetical protein DD435_12765 [Cyanobacteria bacterium UBA8530]|nr:hypothetical protein [Cyanobacteria bacterium UBA8530]